MKLVTVTLETPIARGDTAIASVQLRKPASGELRGLSLAEVSTLKTDALIELLPRITMPPLTGAEVEALDPADLFQCAIEVAGFLLPAGTIETLRPAT
jgi:hypothetical protein